MYIIHILKCLNVIIVHKEVTVEVLEREFNILLLFASSPVGNLYLYVSIKKLYFQTYIRYSCASGEFELAGLILFPLDARRYVWMK
jgi:hypothetical protein